MAIQKTNPNPLTPGIFTHELNTFSNSIVAVPTAIPVFIGYTQKASYSGQDLSRQAIKITSLTDYVAFFGTGPAHDYQPANKGAATQQFTVTETSKLSKDLPNNTVYINTGSGSASADQAAENNPLCACFSLNDGNEYSLYISAGNYYLYNSIQLFYQNSGGDCYVISMGDYTCTPSANDFLQAHSGGNLILQNQPDITLILFPDALLLGGADYYTVASDALVTAQLTQCSFAIIDTYDGAKVDNSNPLLSDITTTLRSGVGSNALSYGAAYFPWLNTTVMQNGDINFLNFEDLTEYINMESTVLGASTVAQLTADMASAKAAVAADPAFSNPVTQQTVAAAHNALYKNSRNYKMIVDTALSVANVLPPSPAMAGVYAHNDNMNGVWTTPANVSVSAVVSPTTNLNDTQQQSFNIDIAGKSIDVIRSFAGVGVRVWGARTLDGNSPDWRYINVRRTMTMIEQSIKISLQAYEFAPNEPITWALVNSVLSNFLNSLWAQGALVGPSPATAYKVAVGLGSTMTEQDILNGIMRVVVQVALTHPAEFMLITFDQQMQSPS